jgi:putative transposase
MPIRYWCGDESRLGLKTITCRTITLKGIKPIGITNWQRDNFYLYSIQMDNGSFHKSLYLQWPDNIIPIFQPSHSPELNPIERLWEHIKQALSWEDCTNLTQLRGKLTQVLNSISRKAIASICGWDYITKALLSATS